MGQGKVPICLKNSSTPVPSIKNDSSLSKKNSKSTFVEATNNGRGSISFASPCSYRIHILNDTVVLGCISMNKIELN